MRIFEALAAQEHRRWASWQRYLHSKCKRNEDGSLTIPAGYVSNLERQIATLYANLTDKEKESDRKEARNTIKLLRQVSLKDWAYAIHMELGPPGNSDDT